MPSTPRAHPLSTGLRAATRRRALVWVAGSLVGGAVMALPDSGDRLFSISDLHGPSLVDAVGAVVAIGAWLPLAALLPTLWHCAPRPLARTTVGLALLGAVGLVVTLVGDLGWSWVLPVVALVVAQLLLVADGIRVEPGPLAT